MCKKCKKADLGFLSEKFPDRTHMCLIYSKEDERANVIATFLAESGKNSVFCI